MHKYKNTYAPAKTWVGVGNQLQVHCNVNCEQDIEGQGAVNGSDWLLLHCTNISISQLNSQWLPQVTSTKRLDRSQFLFYFVPHSQAGLTTKTYKLTLVTTLFSCSRGSDWLMVNSICASMRARIWFASPEELSPTHMCGRQLSISCLRWVLPISRHHYKSGWACFNN